MKHFINDRARLVTEAVETAVRLGEGKLARLDGAPAIKVVFRTDADRGKVAVISGGGAGHEPAHVGFVADGLLTAAVCGEVFASPSVDAVLAGILAVTGPAGALLVVKNYTGDRLNFGLAAEKARALGLAVEMVVVSDDVALDTPRPRGIAGTLFVHKIAGHYARAGASLVEVKAIAELAAGRTRSIGLSLGTATIPGQPTESRIGEAEAELGLGIHGEPGARVIPHAPVDELVAKMVEVLAPQGRVAVLLNDLGGVPPIELAVAARAALDAIPEAALVFGPDRLMTSLDMKGISISTLPLTPEIEAALRSPAPPFPVGRAPAIIAPQPLPEAVQVRAVAPSSHPERRRVLERVCSTFVELQAELDALDARVGDGDTGTTFATAARALLADLDALPFADAPLLCAAIADRLSKAMGGSSGILLAILVAAMGTKAPDWPAALTSGIARLELYGGAKLGDRTMLDALVPAAAALPEGLAAAAKAAAEGAARTAAMTKASAGRSSYVRGEALAGVPDPGAVAVARAFAALA